MSFTKMEMSTRSLTREDILAWLHEENETELQRLWSWADSVRQAHVGDAVHLRGLVEISNHCVRQCAYCGLRAGHRGLERYRLSMEEIQDCARTAVDLGYGTVVLQAGEDPGISAEWMAEVVRWIKANTPLAVTLSLGERTESELHLWKEAGANRYLLRFETSDRALYERIHPTPAGAPDRMMILRFLRELGYEVGSGVMVGIPGQTYESLAEDILTFRDLDLDMIGMGPFLRHPDTPLGELGLVLNETGGILGEPSFPRQRESTVPRQLPIFGRPAIHDESSLGPDQVPNTVTMTCKVVALARLVCPEANIPSTTALATLDKAEGREKGLACGANVVMPNLTPSKYRVLYEIYPDKACIYESAIICAECLKNRLAAIGREVGVGQGGRRRRMAESFVSHDNSRKG